MSFRIDQGDVLDRLRELPEASVQCVVTSPPYWGLRDYGVDGQIGLEATPAEFLAKMVAVFREVRRVLRADGTCWVNMGDSYAGGGNGGGGSFAKDGIRCAEHGSDKNVAHRVGERRYPLDLKPKDLIGMPWRLAFALQEDGWWLRQDIIWSKPNPMPESVTDRCTKAHEYIFLLTKSARYYYDAEAIKEAAVADHPSGNTTHKGLTAYEEGDERHRTKQGLVAYASRNGKNSFRGQGSNRDTEQGPANRDGRDMSTVGVGGTRNKRSVWEIATESFSEAHFATFPIKLVEPCILAGTSERGCCSDCGAPWLRVVEKTGGTTGKSWHNHDDDLGRGARGGDNGTNAAAAGMKDYKVETVGWKAGCTCGVETVPCTVLDPFNGAGTTGLVAVRLGREYIGIELNPKYAEMATRRIIGDRPLFYIQNAGRPAQGNDAVDGIE